MQPGQETDTLGVWDPRRAGEVELNAFVCFMPAIHFLVYCC